MKFKRLEDELLFLDGQGYQNVFGEKLSLEDQEKQAHIDSYKQNTSERKRYVTKSFNLICWYLGAVFILLVCNGVTCVPFYLSEAVELALLTTTTANVLTIFYFVMKYLFNPKGE